jgi:hypothetical protein
VQSVSFVWRKTILAASQFFAFLHSLGHELPRPSPAGAAAMPSKSDMIPPTLLSAEAIWLGKIKRGRNVRGSLIADVRQLCRRVSHLFAPRHARQSGLGLGDESAHNRSDRQNFTDAAGGLAGPENTLMLATGLGR